MVEVLRQRTCLEKLDVHLQGLSVGVLAWVHDKDRVGLMVVEKVMKKV